MLALALAANFILDTPVQSSWTPPPRLLATLPAVLAILFLASRQPARRLFSGWLNFRHGFQQYTFAPAGGSRGPTQPLTAAHARTAIIKAVWPEQTGANAPQAEAVTQEAQAEPAPGAAAGSSQDNRQGNPSTEPSDSEVQPDTGVLGGLDNASTAEADAKSATSHPADASSTAPPPPKRFRGPRFRDVDPGQEGSDFRPSALPSQHSNSRQSSCSYGGVRRMTLPPARRHMPVLRHAGCVISAYTSASGTGKLKMP